MDLRHNKYLATNEYSIGSPSSSELRLIGSKKQQHQQHQQQHQPETDEKNYIRRILIADANTGSALVDYVVRWNGSLDNPSGVSALIRVFYLFSKEINGGGIKRILLEDQNVSPHFMGNDGRGRGGSLLRSLKFASCKTGITPSDIQQSLGTSSPSSRDDGTGGNSTPPRVDSGSSSPHGTAARKEGSGLCLICEKCEDAIIGIFLDTSDEQLCMRAKAFAKQIGSSFNAEYGAKVGEYKRQLRNIADGIDEEHSEKEVLSAFAPFNSRIQSMMMMTTMTMNATTTTTSTTTPNTTIPTTTTTTTTTSSSMSATKAPANQNKT